MNLWLYILIGYAFVSCFIAYPLVTGVTVGKGLAINWVDYMLATLWPVLLSAALLGIGWNIVRSIHAYGILIGQASVRRQDVENKEEF